MTADVPQCPETRTFRAIVRRCDLPAGHLADPRFPYHETNDGCGRPEYSWRHGVLSHGGFVPS